MNELFPGADHTRQQRIGWLDLFDGQNYAHGHASLHECQRCKAWVADREGHTAWHRSVDTDQTATVPGVPIGLLQVVNDDQAEQIRQHGHLTGYVRVYSGDAMDPAGVTMVPTDTQRDDTPWPEEQQDQPTR